MNDQARQKTAMKPSRPSAASVARAALLVASVIVTVTVIVYCVSRKQEKGPFKAEKKEGPVRPLALEQPEPGGWRFIVSGDSRDCGDLVVPAIAAHSKEHFRPVFYWHLGDLRAIYKVDEDMAFAGRANDGSKLACKEYLPEAWADFIRHQIHAFGTTPFYLGIGNHEVIPPKGFAAGKPQTLQPEVNEEQFTSEFADWLLAPALKQQRVKDKDCDHPAAMAAHKGKSKSPSTPCLILPRNYYHWIRGGVDFIYLDNASNIFGPAQLQWFAKRIASDGKNPTVRTLVVGMHEALPDSISSDHAMCDDRKKDKKEYPYDQSCREGRQAYTELLGFQNQHPDKQVYVLASHSHFYMDGIFKKKPVAERLRGWIVGTAGAVRYKLPADSNLSNASETDVYGYLLGIVDANGNVQFEFERVNESDVPAEARQRYQPDFVNWCFAHNSENPGTKRPLATNICIK